MNDMTPGTIRELTEETLLNEAKRRAGLSDFGDMWFLEPMRKLLDSMNTGHRGALATIHASSAQGALLRLRTLLMRSASSLLPAEADAEIRSSIHLVVHIDRVDGQRHIQNILNVAGNNVGAT